MFALGEAQAEGAAYLVPIPPVGTLVVTSEAYVLSEYQWVLQCPDEVVWAEGSRYG